MQSFHTFATLPNEVRQEVMDWFAVVLARVPALLSEAEALPLVDGIFVANLRRLTSTTPLAERQRDEFGQWGRWPLLAREDATPAVLAPAQPPRFTGHAAQVLLDLLRRFDEMSDSTATMMTSTEKG